MIRSDNIPEPLKGTRRWVVFRCIPQPDGSVKKIPLTVRGTLARCDNPIDWATSPEVLTAIEFCIGTHPAFVLGEDYPLRVLDLDHCINDDGNLTPLAVRIVSRCEGAYIEKSVSGHGLHILVWASEKGFPTNPVPGLEIYGGVPRFIIMTGNLWNPLPTSDPELNRQLAYREALT